MRNLINHLTRHSQDGATITSRLDRVADRARSEPRNNLLIDTPDHVHGAKEMQAIGRKAPIFTLLQRRKWRDAHRIARGL